MKVKREMEKRNRERKMGRGIKHIIDGKMGPVRGLFGHPRRSSDECVTHATTDG
jgi:hypothetical protein